MIAYLKGILLEKHTGSIVLDINGVGYEVAIALSTFFGLPNEGQPYSCYIQTIVREDTFALYGFADKQARALFQSLIKISGIGPKVALGILSSVDVNEFTRIIQQKDSKALVKLPGIGKKTAERLMLELSDKLMKDLPEAIKSELEMQPIKDREEAIQALAALGYPAKQAEKVIIEIDDGSLSADQLIRAGLKTLSPVIS